MTRNLQKLQEHSLMTLEQVTAVFSLVTAACGIFVSWKVYQGQKLLSQRQLIVPLWDYLSKADLRDIDPEKPITPDIVRSVNTLELIALCCEGEMVDPRVIKRTFSPVFIQLHEKIALIPNIPGLNKSGQQLLGENRATGLFYKHLKEEDLRHGELH